MSWSVNQKWLEQTLGLEVKLRAIVMFLLDVCPTWTRGVALVDLLRRSVLRCDKPWDIR
jgi:hypothetical protein